MAAFIPRAGRDRGHSWRSFSGFPRRRRSAFISRGPERRLNGSHRHPQLHQAQDLVRGARLLDELQQPAEVVPAQRRRKHRQLAAGSLREHERRRLAFPGFARLERAHAPQPRAEAVDPTGHAGHAAAARAGVLRAAAHAQRERTRLRQPRRFHHGGVLPQDLVPAIRHLLLDAAGADVRGLEVRARGSLGLGLASLAGSLHVPLQFELEVVIAEVLALLVEPEGRVDLLVVEAALGSCPRLGSELGVEVVLDRVVGAAGKELRDGCPAVAELLVGGHDGAILRVAEVVATERGVQLVAPSQATGFAAAAGDPLGDERPVACAVGHHQHAQPSVLLRVVRGGRKVVRKHRAPRVVGMARWSWRVGTMVGARLTRGDRGPGRAPASAGYIGEPDPEASSAPVRRAIARRGAPNLADPRTKTSGPNIWARRIMRAAGIGDLGRTSGLHTVL